MRTSTASYKPVWESRYVVTSRLTGWLSLRFTPREPKYYPERVDTTGRLVTFTPEGVEVSQ